MCMLRWHGGVDVKRLGLIAGLVAALALGAGTSVFALEEQKAPVAPQTPGAEQPSAAVQDVAPAAKTETGTEIRIPGLGKLGTLPKMDFGLELLYGASEGKPVQDPAPDDTADPSDLTVRGSIKHRF